MGQRTAFHKVQADGIWCGTRRQRPVADMQSPGNACTHTTLFRQLSGGARAHPPRSKTVLRPGSNMAARRPKKLPALRPAVGMQHGQRPPAAPWSTGGGRCTGRRLHRARGGPQQAAAGGCREMWAAQPVRLPLPIPSPACRAACALVRHQSSTPASAASVLCLLAAPCGVRLVPLALVEALCSGAPGFQCFRRQQPARMRQRCASLGQQELVYIYVYYIHTHIE